MRHLHSARSCSRGSFDGLQSDSDRVQFSAEQQIPQEVDQHASSCRRRAALRAKAVHPPLCVMLCHDVHVRTDVSHPKQCVNPSHESTRRGHSLVKRSSTTRLEPRKESRRAWCNAAAQPQPPGANHPRSCCTWAMLSTSVNTLVSSSCLCVRSCSFGLNTP